MFIGLLTTINDNAAYALYRYIYKILDYSLRTCVWELFDWGAHNWNKDVTMVSWLFKSLSKWEHKSSSQLLYLCLCNHTYCELCHFYSYLLLHCCWGYWYYFSSFKSLQDVIGCVKHYVCDFSHPIYIFLFFNLHLFLSSMLSNAFWVFMLLVKLGQAIRRRQKVLEKELTLYSWWSFYLLLIQSLTKPLIIM